ncbi:MAG: exosortase N [Bacteroidota bacterium]
MGIKNGRVREVIHRDRRLLIGLLLILIPLIVWARDYIPTGFGFWIGLAIFPFTFSNIDQSRRSHRYLIWALVFGGLHLLLGNKMLLFMTALCSMLWLIECTKGKVGYLPMIQGFLLTPFLNAWMNLFTFPLRMYQSKQIGAILSRLGLEVEVQGNRFLVEGYGFMIEEGCLGIHTLIFSFLLTTFILSLRVSSVNYSLLKMGIWYGVAFVLAFIANFIRSLILVIFRSPPDTFGHELTGIISVIAFVGLPIWWLGTIGTTSINKGDAAQFSLKMNSPYLSIATSLLPVLVGSFLLYAHFFKAQPEAASLNEMHLAHFEKVQIKPDVAQFRNEEILLYIKAPCSPWRSDHNPQTCWSGSGFTFDHVEMITNGAGYSIMVGKLIRKDDVLYTSWWYDNGQKITADQWKWRKAVLKGDPPYYLLNLTMEDKEGLLEELEDIVPGGFGMLDL